MKSPIESILLNAIRAVAKSEHIHLSDYTPFVLMAVRNGDGWLGAKALLEWSGGR